MLREAFDSGRPLIYIRSAEEHRVARVLREIGLPTWTWTMTEGLRLEDQPAEPGTESPRAVLDFIASYTGTGVFHLKDFHESLRDSPEIRRRLRDVYEVAVDREKFVVISSAVRLIPEEVERSILFTELRPPDVIELSDFVREEAPSAGEHVDQIARALQGLTLDEAKYALRRARASGKPFGPESMPELLEEKRLLVNRSGYVEYFSTHTGMGDVGGLPALKKWLKERQKLFQLRDRIDSEIVPKGLLMMGIPGCGKSLAVKAIASYFGLPLYRVDMIEIFSGRHGKPEGAFVAACRMLEDMSPAVLWFDEIEMGITSSETGGEQGRIFAFFLTWMQEKSRGLFVAATANRIDLLPAEMLRKGRFDEVFFVDLPVEDERLEIFRIHLERRGIDPAPLNIPQLMEFTVGWTGAEIEQCVISAVTRAKLAERDITPQDLLTISVGLVPLSRTMKEQIDHIRSWAFERAVRATPRTPGRQSS